MNFFLFFSFLVAIAIGSIDDLRDAIRPIPHTKQYVETLQTNESMTRLMVDRAQLFLRMVLDRQSELISSSRQFEDDDATLLESWRPELKVSEEYLLAYIDQDNVSGFSDFLFSITDLSLLEEIDFLIEFRIVPKFERQIRDYRTRIFRFKAQAVGVLESAESQAVVLLQRMTESEFALLKSIVSRQKNLSKISNLIDRNKRIVEQIGAPILPAVRTGFSFGLRYSETSSHIPTWQNAIDYALEESPVDIPNRVKAVIRKLPMNQHNEARKYVEKKLVTNLETEVREIHKQLEERQSRLNELKIQQTTCLGIYTTIVVDQTWFAQIH